MNGKATRARVSRQRSGVLWEKESVWLWSWRDMGLVSDPRLRLLGNRVLRMCPFGRWVRTPICPLAARGRVRTVSSERVEHWPSALDQRSSPVPFPVPFLSQPTRRSDPCLSRSCFRQRFAVAVRTVQAFTHSLLAVTGHVLRSRLSGSPGS